MYEHDVLRVSREKDGARIEVFHGPPLWLRYFTTTCPVILGWIEQ